MEIMEGRWLALILINNTAPCLSVQANLISFNPMTAFGIIGMQRASPSSIIPSAACAWSSYAKA